MKQRVMRLNTETLVVHLRENVGGSEKSRLLYWSDKWFKRVHRGYDEPAGCPWA